MPIEPALNDDIIEIRKCLISFDSVSDGEETVPLFDKVVAELRAARAEITTLKEVVRSLKTRNAMLAQREGGGS